MSILKDQAIDQGAIGVSQTNALQYARGLITLVAGTGSQNIGGFRAAAQAFVSRTVAAGGSGDLRVTYDGTSVVVTSTDNTETSTVSWLLID